MEEINSRVTPAPLLAPCPSIPPENAELAADERPAKRARLSDKNDTTSFHGTSEYAKSKPKIEVQHFFVMHANLDGFTTHGIDIQAEVDIMKHKPGLICLNETKLQKGDPDPALAGYHLLCRRARKSKTRGGLIGFFR